MASRYACVTIFAVQTGHDLVQGLVPRIAARGARCESVDLEARSEREEDGDASRFSSLDTDDHVDAEGGRESNRIVVVLPDRASEPPQPAREALTNRAATSLDHRYDPTLAHAGSLALSLLPMWPMNDADGYRASLVESEGYWLCWNSTGPNNLQQILCRPG